MIENILEAIQKAEAEAIKKGIEINTIFLNDKFDFCRGFYRGIKLPGGDILACEYPPMILSKDVRLVDFLPEQYPFALGKTNSNTSDYIKSLERDIDLVKKYVKAVGEGDNRQLVFKGVSSKKNPEDFARLLEVIK